MAAPSKGDKRFRHDDWEEHFIFDYIKQSYLIAARWLHDAVGKRIAGHARAGPLAGSLLIVEVDDEVWRRQLTFLTGQILERLKQVLGRELVSRIDFRLSTPRRMPQRATTASGDEADTIPDAGLRMAYRASRRKASA